MASPFYLESVFIASPFYLESVFMASPFYLESVFKASPFYLESVVGPAAELHDAGLLVEGEVLHVHLAGGVVDGGRLPLHPPLVVQGRLCGQRHLKVSVRTGEKGDESAVLYTVQ